MSKRVAVVGGGISGLSAAYFLAQAGADCVLIEEQPRLGGVIATERVEGCLVEAGPDSYISQKPWALELIRELGLGDEVIGSNDDRRKTYVLRGGRLLALPDGLQFLAPTKILPILRSPLLGPTAKLRMALEYLRRPGPERADRSVAEMVLEHYGWEANEYLAQPMLAGVYGGSPESLSVNSVMPRFVELERRYGSLSRGMLQARKAARGNGGAKPPALFQTLRGGMQLLVDELARRIEPEVESVTARAERVLPREGGGWEVRLADGAIEADDVVLAAPAWQSGALLKGADAALSELLASGIGYSSSITIALIYDQQQLGRDLNGFGFLVPRREKRPIAACTWVNTKFDGRAAENRALLRTFLSGDDAADRLGSSDDELADLAHDELSRIMGFTARPVAHRVKRWRRSMALYGVGHSKLLEMVEDRRRALPGLYLGGNGYEGIGVPDCVRRSREIAAAITGSA